MAMTPAIFLNKDGTVLVNLPHNCDPRLMAFAPGAPEALYRLAQLGLPLIIVTNQAGVALGKFPIGALEAMHRRLVVMFESVGAHLHGFYCCPHHPAGIVAPYSGHCTCRKPRPGLLLEAAREHGLNLSSSWFIGNILDDVEAGNKAGCKTLLLDNGNETQWLHGSWRIPTLMAPDLDAASKAIVADMAELADKALGSTSMGMRKVVP